MRRQYLELPEDDTLASLDPATRGAIALHWRHRAAAELGVAVAFEALLPRLRGASAADAVIALAVKAVDDERRHAELCVRLAARYLDAPVEAPAPRYEGLPDFGTGDEALEVALTTLGMCCINESIASEWIRSSWEVASSPTAIAANRFHLQDEIDHARLGWAHLASSAVGPGLRAALRAWAPKLIAVNVAEWKKPDPYLPPAGVPAHGHLSLADSAAAIDAAVRDVVLPGLAHLGLGGSVS
ncbi:MAG: hypothetical protein KF795_26615 [Labilithrix sp.]|nr:hypothetical protein [Labilithrix sp.]